MHKLTNNLDATRFPLFIELEKHGKLSCCLLFTVCIGKVFQAVHSGSAQLPIECRDTACVVDMILGGSTPMLSLLALDSLPMSSLKFQRIVWEGYLRL